MKHIHYLNLYYIYVYAVCSPAETTELVGQIHSAVAPLPLLGTRKYRCSISAPCIRPLVKQACVVMLCIKHGLSSTFLSFEASKYSEVVARKWEIHFPQVMAVRATTLTMNIEN